MADQEKKRLALTVEVSGGGRYVTVPVFEGSAASTALLIEAAQWARDNLAYPGETIQGNVRLVEG